MTSVPPFNAYLLNDNLIQLAWLRNKATFAYPQETETQLEAAPIGSFINDATISVTVKDTAGVEVSGETWPLSMGYVTSSKGKYQALLQYALVLAADDEYRAEISGVGDGLRGFWDVPLIGAKRRS